MTIARLRRRLSNPGAERLSGGWLLAAALVCCAACAQGSTSPPADGQAANREAPAPHVLAWFLGKQLSLACAVHASSGASQGMVDDLMGKATTLAGALDITVPALPPRGSGTVKDVVVALDYLLKDPGPRIASDLEARHGARARALFQLATRVNSLLIVYGPDDTTGQAALLAARGFARDAGITEATLDALSSSVSSGASYDEVKRAVFKAHELVERQVREEG